MPTKNKEGYTLMVKSLRIPLRLGVNATEIECKFYLYALECKRMKEYLDLEHSDWLESSLFFA